MLTTFVSFVNSFGILPERLFEYNENLVNETIFPIEVGILPFILLLKPYKIINVVSLLISDGILPLRQFDENRKSVSEIMFPIETGILPFIKLFAI
jgi:hypothetical protein